MDYPPLISVIMPSYNQAMYVEEALLSLCNQSYSNIEIIFVDDGSTDETYEKVTTVQLQFPSKIKIVRQTNQGMVIALNKGLEFVQGKYMTLFCSDDICMSYRFEQQIKYMEFNYDVQAVWSNGIRLDGKTNSIRMHNQILKNLLSKNTATILNYLYNHKYSFFTPTGLFRTSLIKAIDGWDPELILDDWVLNVRIFEYLIKTGGKYAYLDQDVMYYRQHEASLTHNMERHVRCFVTAQEKYVPEHLRLAVVSQTYWDYGLLALTKRQLRLGLRYLWKSQTMYFAPKRIGVILYKFLRYPFKLKKSI